MLYYSVLTTFMVQLIGTASEAGLRHPKVPQYQHPGPIAGNNISSVLATSGPNSPSSAHRPQHSVQSRSRRAFLSVVLVS